VSICVRFAFDQPAGAPPALTVAFSSLLSLGAEPRPSRLDDGGVDDLPAHGEIASVAQPSIEALEQPLDRAGPA
jgi:hypothetical protein